MNRQELMSFVGAGLPRKYREDGWLGSDNEHDPDCPKGRAISCSVGVECEHGYDVCPKCDPCECSTPTTN